VDLADHSHSCAFCLRGASQQDADIYVMINAYWQDLPFIIQEGEAHDWWRVADTSLPSPSDFAESGKEVRLQSPNYTVKARSIVILIRFFYEL